VRPIAEKIDEERDENPEMKGDPEPNANRHEALGFHECGWRAIGNNAGLGLRGTVGRASLPPHISMDAELQKLVDAGKLTPAGAAQLNQLKPGAFCLHKSWGFGRSLIGICS
jgi:hypothetical protein